MYRPMRRSGRMHLAMHACVFGGMAWCAALLMHRMRPLCVAQFARLYPLGQRDLPIERKHVDFGPLMPASARIENPSRDYTPPSAPPCLRACSRSLLCWALRWLSLC